MHPETKEVIMKYMPLLIGIGVAAIVSFSIIIQVLIPCSTGELPADYCFGENNAFP